MDRIRPQMRVETREGRKGTTAPDFMNCCSPDETPVVWDGEQSSEGTDTEKLTVIGPENAVPDLKGCGAGRGADCCIFLTASGDGLHCERFSSLRYQLIFKLDTMVAKRMPPEPYPLCQKFKDGSDGA